MLREISLTYTLYTRRLTADEQAAVAETHEYRRLTKEEFLHLLPMVTAPRQNGRLVVNSKWVEIFLYRLGRVATVVDVAHNEHTADRQIKLAGFPPGPQDHALIIEKMSFPDGQFTGHRAEGEFAVLVPRLT